MKYKTGGMSKAVMKKRGGTFKWILMALPPQMVAPAMGPGGPGMSAEEQMTEIQVPLPGMEELPPGIEIVGEEQLIEVEAEEYDHNANLAEVLDDSVLGALSSDLILRWMRTRVLL